MLIPILKHFVPIPDLTKCQRFCFVGPHPDDIEVGCGATVSLLAKAGKDIMFLVATDGGAGTSDPNMPREKLVETRMEESKRSAALLGVEKVAFLAFPDGGFYTPVELAKKMAAEFIAFDPDVVFCPDPKMPSEIHPDHLKTGEAASTASLISAFPLMAAFDGIEFDKDHPEKFRYRTLAYYFTNRPNKIMKTTKADYLKQLEALKCHKSQYGNKDDFDSLSLYLNLRRMAMGFKRLRCSGEGFFVMAPTHQHCFPEINRY